LNFHSLDKIDLPRREWTMDEPVYETSKKPVIDDYDFGMLSGGDECAANPNAKESHS
jgi:hypothetical protein